MTAGTAGFGYDNEGQISSGYGAGFTFDQEHRLTGAAGASYSYDGAGNRLQKVSSGATTRYIYDAGGNLLAEADGSNNITRYYIYGKGLLAMVTPAGDVYCYHFNPTGSTVAITDHDQVMVNKYAYDQFGNIGNQEEAIPQPFKFVGQHGVMTEPNGFYYMKARYYDPNVGRFVSEDPAGFDGGDVNLMAYVQNNPILNVDPSGLCTERSWTEAIMGRTPTTEELDRYSNTPISYGEIPISGFTRHGLNQAISRDGVGVASRAILDAVRNPVRIVEQVRGAVRYVGENATVILNHAGEVITTWARNSLGWRIR